MFYSWARLSRLGGARSKWCEGLRERQACVGHSVASVGTAWAGRVWGKGCASALAAPWHAGHLLGPCSTQRGVHSPAVSVFTGHQALPVAAALCHHGFGLTTAFFSLGFWGCGNDPSVGVRG